MLRHPGSALVEGFYQLAAETFSTEMIAIDGQSKGKFNIFCFISMYICKTKVNFFDAVDELGRTIEEVATFTREIRTDFDVVRLFPFFVDLVPHAMTLESYYDILRLLPAIHFTHFPRSVKFVDIRKHIW